MPHPDLPALRKIAEGAMTPNRWKAHDDDQAGPGWDWFVVGPQPKRIEEMNEQTARYIATFDPPTVIAILDRAHYAEGVADLAMKCRDDAEARAEAAEASLAQAVEMARREERGTVIVHWPANGDSPDYYVVGDAVRLFVVDEKVPNDRVYEFLPRSEEGIIRQIIPEDAEIGSNQDARHPAIKAKVEAYIRGEKHLTVVEDEP